MCTYVGNIRVRVGPGSLFQRRHSERGARAHRAQCRAAGRPPL